VPAARNITDAKGARALIYATPKSQPDTLYIGLNDRDPAWHDLYKLTISTGKRELLRKNTEHVSAWIFDNVRSAASRRADNRRRRHRDLARRSGCALTDLLVHRHGRLRAGALRQGQQAGLPRDEQGRSGPVASRPARSVHKQGDPGRVRSARQGRLRRGDLLDKTDTLIATSYTDERERVYFKDKAFGADYALLKKKLGGKQIASGLDHCRRAAHLITANSDTEPGETYLFDRATKALTLQYRIREKLPRAALAPMKPVSYSSSDGLTIPAYLTLPVGVPAKGLPAIVCPTAGRGDATSGATAGFRSSTPTAGTPCCR
jgi:dipeptidyl aminopeptidase/acylaminoacyl peptidase